MKRYAAERFIQMLVILFGTSFIIFFLFAMLPGDYIDSNVNLTPERAKELKALYGLDQPIWQRYVTWLGNVLSGDFGFSLKYQENVLSLLRKYVWNSFFVAFLALLVTWSAAMITGVISAVRKYSWFDGIVTFLVFASMAFPSFFISLLFIKWFGVDLKILPVGGMIDTGSTSTGFSYVLEAARHMILPVVILSMLGIGSLTRYFRSGMLDVIRQDYIRTARAKGLKERTVIWKHALKNALIPAITLLAFELPGLFSGAIIIEQIFGLPGVGRIQLESVHYRDYPVLMAFTLFLSCLTIVGNFLADIAYAAVDPRVRLK
ncbi:ABC transporter permease [Bacillus velezensis]|uniref:ABC transporter permease n=1 Tax=Bacillus velezensis TaxID=492670 RepID=UPI00286401CE|nr:ABC transporter permease [Bacillus velezensis]MDR7907951.1 ABC transporter permease [Bacillus velezensis]